MTTLNSLIKDIIHEHGFIDVAHFMSLALAHPQHGYYIKQDPFGKEGDFTTAPEISQLFGEMIAVYLCRSYQTAPFSHLIEIGPGRGTLMSDILRVIEKLSPEMYKALRITLVETSPYLIKKQQDTLDRHSNIVWESVLELDALNEDYFILGNEFFDALPIHQFAKENDLWHERVITLKDDNLVWGLVPCDASSIPKQYQDNDFYEYNPYAEECITAIATSGARALFVDYGYTTCEGLKDTLQALKNHEYRNVLQNIGDQDLTTHVNFLRLHDLSESLGRKTTVCSQGYFLTHMGIEERTKQLILQNPSQTYSLQKDLDRLIGHDKMGELFKVLTIE